MKQARKNILCWYFSYTKISWTIGERSKLLDRSLRLKFRWMSLMWGLFYVFEDMWWPLEERKRMHVECWDVALFQLTHSSTQWRKSSSSSLQVSFVHGLLFTRSLHCCSRSLNVAHAWSSPHNSFNFVKGSCCARGKTRVKFIRCSCCAGNLQCHRCPSFLFQYVDHCSDVYVHRHPWLSRRKAFRDLKTKNSGCSKNKVFCADRPSADFVDVRNLQCTFSIRAMV